jgi:hypothetical protein
MANGTIRFSQVGLLTGLKRHAINARARVAFNNNELQRSHGNQILLNSSQVKQLIEDRLLDVNLHGLTPAVSSRPKGRVQAALALNLPDLGVVCISG